MTHFTLISALPRNEVVRLLRGNIDSRWKFFGERLVVGSVDHSSFSLYWRVSYRNSFQTYLFGRLTRENEGTRIRGHAGMHPFGIVFMTIWIGGVLSVGLVAIVETGQLVSPFTLASLGIALFGVVLVRFGRWLSEGDDKKLIDFLKITIDAESAE